MPLICSSDRLESSPTKQRNKRKSQEPKRLPSFEQTNDEQTSDGEDHAISPSPRLSSLSPGIILIRKRAKYLITGYYSIQYFCRDNLKIFIAFSRNYQVYYLLRLINALFQDHQIADLLVQLVFQPRKDLSQIKFNHIIIDITHRQENQRTIKRLLVSDLGMILQQLNPAQ